MPHFKMHLRHRNHTEPDNIGLECTDLHEAYLLIFQTIPDTARDLLVSGEDPMDCAYIISDAKGRRLMEVPFTEVLKPSEWRAHNVSRRPYGWPRSEKARDDLALSTFRRMFGHVDAGCVLLTPELIVTEINDFGARHSHVDPEAVRKVSILDIFSELKGEPKKNFTDFMLLARSGASSEVIDLPYLVLDERGQTANGFWNSKTWPIFDDDGMILGLVEWAMPFTRPTADGKTIVRVTKRLVA